MTDIQVLEAMTSEWMSTSEVLERVLDMRRGEWEPCYYACHVNNLRRRLRSLEKYRYVESKQEIVAHTGSSCVTNFWRLIE